MKRFVFALALILFWATLVFGQSSVITTQPQNQTAVVGQTATFTITISDPTCSVMWQRNGVNIHSGVGLVSYTTPPVKLADNGAKFGAAVYNCKTAANAHSMTAKLTVNAAAGAPTISVQPANQTGTLGQTATFSVVASGAAPLRHQWQKNNTNISGATSSSYITPATAVADSGSTFRVVVSNAAGSITSNAATLRVNPPPVAPAITTQPANQTATVGQTATFSVVATGTAPLSYQWQKNGTDISGATSSSYTTPATATSDSGATFQVTVSNSLGSATSNPATLTVASGAAIATVTVSATNPGRAIPADFGGISTYSLLDNCDYMGTATAPNPIYRQLIKNLIFPGQTFIITSEDDDGPAGGAVSGEPSAAQVGCPGQLYADLKNAGYSFNYWNGVPECLGSQTHANQYATAFLNNMPAGWVPNMVIGNEPDLTSACGGYSTYAARFPTWTTGIRALGGGANTLFMGPELGATGSGNVVSFVNAQSTRLAAGGEHGYPMAGGSCTGGIGVATIPLELSSSAATAFNASLASAISAAHAKGIPLRLSETNSAFCGGKAGVSDVQASALWVMDFMFNLASVGLDGVNIFSDEGDNYDLFGFTSNSAPYHISFIRPEYYGLLAFQQATQNGSKLLPVTVTTSKNISVWATIDASNTVRVLVINKDQSASGDVAITLNGFGDGTLSKLVAPSVSSKTGVTWAGQTFDGSTDGTIQGTVSTTAVVPAGNVYTFSVATTSAVLLTINP